MKRVFFLLVCIFLLTTSLSRDLPAGIVLEGELPDSPVVDLSVLTSLEEQEFQIESVTINTEEERIFFDVEAFSEKRILGLIPVKVNSLIRIDASSGEIISHKKPWWSFLTI